MGSARKARKYLKGGTSADDIESFLWLVVVMPRWLLLTEKKISTSRCAKKFR
jgi:hypothetical protein